MNLLETWQMDADDIPLMTFSKMWVERMLKWKTLPYLEMDDFGQNLYYVNEDTPVFDQEIWPRPYYNGHFDVVPERVTIPKGFLPTTGDDNQADIEFPDYWLSFWGYKNYFMSKKLFGWPLEWNQFQAYNLGKPLDRYDAVAGSVGRVYKDQTSNDGYWAPLCPIFPGVPTPEEFENGEIPHAISWSMSMTMGGPTAPRGITDVNDERIGTQFKVAQAPAMMIEFNKKAVDVNSGIMMGQLMSLDPSLWTPKRENDYVMSKPLAQREAALTISRCLTRKGWRSNQSGPYNGFPLCARPESTKRYKACGVTSDIMKGIDWSCARAHVPPNARYKDGSFGNREGLIEDYGYHLLA